MPRALSLYLPAWATDLARRRLRRSSPRAAPPDATLVVGVVAQKRVVAHACARARAAGVRAGMTEAHARALLPARAIHAEDHRPARDLASLHSLALWSMRFSPVVAIDPPDGLVLDIAGCAHLFAGERAMGARIVRSLRALGLDARVAIAPTFAGARAVARAAPATVSVVPPGRVREALAPLPLHALAIDPDARDALAEVGVERVAHLLDLPRAHLPARFGDALLLRLDQALGDALESIDPVRIPPAFHAARGFDAPTTRPESIEAAARDALDELLHACAARRCGLRLLLVELARASSTPARLSISLSRASGDARHLWSLLRPRLERVHLAWGVERVSLAGVRTARLRDEQRLLDASREGGSPRLGELIDTLANRLGPARVARAEPVRSNLPERAVRLVPIGEDARPRDAHPSPPLDRPSILFHPPEPARVVALTPDGPVHRLSWRGRDHAVALCFGPERIEPEWWRDAPNSATRDWFRAQDTHGRWLWIMREAGRWFVHGLWA